MPLPLRSVALLGLLPLAGCGIFDNTPKFPPICPSVALLDDASDITTFKPGGRDITDVVLDGRITAIRPAQCTRAARNAVKVTMNMQVSLTRGPAATGRQVLLPYLVTVMDEGAIADQQDYALTTVFPPNVDHVNVTGQQIELVFPVTAQKQASAYKVFVSLKLTPDQLAYNRKRGLR